MKPRKLITKRFKIKNSGKVLRKKSSQSHYNSNDSGNERRGKRPVKRLNKGTAKKIITLVS